jgi:membrane protein DedA with SNARE-associated domain
MQWVEPLLAQYGYLAIFCLLMLGIVGPLIPDETILIIAGILIHRGTLAWPQALGVAFAGSVCGISLSYALGRSGRGFVLRRAPVKYLELVRNYFERYGSWTLLFGYFIVGVRHFTALVAGVSKMPVPRFALFAYTGGFVWVATFLAIGYFVGDQWERWARYLHAGFFVAAAGVVVGVLVWVRLRRKS